MQDTASATMMIGPSQLGDMNSNQRDEHVQETFEDAREYQENDTDVGDSRRPRPSSLSLALAIEQPDNEHKPADPNMMKGELTPRPPASAFSPGSQEDSTVSPSANLLDKTPATAPLPKPPDTPQEPFSPWDKPIFSQPPSFTDSKIALGGVTPILSPSVSILRSPIHSGAIQKRASLKHHRRSIDRLSLDLSEIDVSHDAVRRPPATAAALTYRSPQTHSARTPQSQSPSVSPENSPFWRQLKSKFTKRDKEASSPPTLFSARSPPPQMKTYHSAVPITALPSSSSAPRLFDLQSIISPRPRIQPPLSAHARPQSSTPNLQAHQTQRLQDPLFQALAPSLGGSPPTSARPIFKPSTPAASPRLSFDFSSHDIANPSSPIGIKRVSIDGYAAQCSRAASLRKAKRRSASIRRVSLSTGSYKLLEPEALASELCDASQTGSDPVLVLDVRPVKDYTASTSRIACSVNVNFPTLLIKRFRKGNFTAFQLESFITTPESRATFARLCPDGKWQNLPLCVVDEHTSEEDLWPSTEGGSMASVLVNVLAQTISDTTAQTSPLQPRQPVLCLKGSWLDLVDELSKISPESLMASSPASIVVPNGDDDCPTPTLDRRTVPTLSTRPTELATTNKGLGRTLTLANGTSTLTNARRPSPEIGPIASSGRPGDAEGQGSISTSLPPTGMARKGRPLQLQRLDTSDSMKLSIQQPPRLLATNSTSPDQGPANSAAVDASRFPMTPIRTTFQSTFGPPGSSLPEGLPSLSLSSQGKIAPPDDATKSEFNVSVIIPGFLYLGPEPATEEDVQVLESVGIKRILNMAVECNTHAKWKGRFEKIATIPMRDSLAEANVQDRIKEACLLLDDADLHGKPTFTHCKAGKSRSVTIVLAYLIHRNHWPLKRAYAHVLERRQGVSPNIGFVAELMRFEEAELGCRSRGILGSGLTPANEQNHFFGPGDQKIKPPSAGVAGSEDKILDPRTPRSARSDLEGRPTIVRHLSLIASTALSLNNAEKTRTREQRSSTHIVPNRNRESMPPGIGYSETPNAGYNSDSADSE